MALRRRELSTWRMPGKWCASGLASCSAPVAGRTGRGVEICGLAADPGQEPRDLQIGPQGLHIGEALGDLGLAVAGMDGRVADLVQPDRAPVRPAFQLRSQVVEAGAGAGRDRSLAERADRIRMRGRPQCIGIIYAPTPCARCPRNSASASRSRTPRIETWSPGMTSIRARGPAEAARATASLAGTTGSSRP
jgi:hypothetical protein